jgi:hypothetical protein
METTTSKVAIPAEEKKSKKEKREQEEIQTYMTDIERFENEVLSKHQKAMFLKHGYKPG